MGAAVAGRHDARGHRSAKPERIPNRHHQIADTRFVRICPFGDGQRLLRIHLQHREICLVVAADQSGRQRCAVAQDHRDLVRALNDVVVGDDVARRINDESGAQ